MGLFAVGWSGVLFGGELVIERGDLVQPIDDFFRSLRLRSGEPVPLRAEKRGIRGDRGVRQRFIHVDLTLGLHGAIQPFARAYR